MTKKCIKKLLFILIAFIFIFSITANVFASDGGINLNTPTNTTNTATTTGTTTLEVVENNVCTIDVEDIAHFEKKITEFNESEKSVTLTLTLTNTKTIEESQKDAEIFFVIDNSSSMTEAYVGDITRKQAVINSANSLVEKLFEANPDIKIGMVGFSSLDSSAGETEGTINDANLRLELSNSEDDVKNAINNLSELKVGPRTNIEAGLTIADEHFSSDKNVDRYIVLLTDGVPNNATDGTFATYSGNVATRTKAKLEEIESAGINIIGAMINLNSEEIEPTTQKTYRALSEEIFGTEENSTISQYYYVPDSEIEDTIVNDIFNNLIVRKDNTLKNITIVDYFPQEIIDNFNFEYVASPNIGTVSQEVDTTNNSITWNIELLSEGETATLSYKLTLKDDYNKEIVDQIIKTNTHVDITGENNGNKLENTSDVSPTVRVKFKDTTIADKVIPQTGSNFDILFVIVISILAIILVTRLVYIKRNRK